MAIYQEPVPQLGELYPQPEPVSDGAVAFLGIFDGWAGPLAEIRAAAAQVQNDLQGVYSNIDELLGYLQGALDAVASSQLADRMNELGLEFGQPNPAGTKIPFSFQIEQLPQPTSPTWGLGDWLTAQIGTYADWLWYYLSAGPPPPIEPW